MLFQVGLYGLIYLICVLVCAKVASRQVRTLVLLIGSYAVYVTWDAWFAIVLIGSTLINFAFGEWLRRKPESSILTFGILVNVLILGTFKYLPEATVSLPFSSLQNFSHLVMPLGISFWTFEGMSYLFDQYRGEDLDPSFVEFATYMAFFPVTISGPVCRMPDMLPQFRSEQRPAWDDIGVGLRRIATGVLMVQLARLLGQGILGGDGVSSGFDHATHWGAFDVWFLAIGYGLQLFFDFAGYTHIVVGAARSMGFTLPENFNRPLQSTTPSIFWTRWHMSLSFWIRDYMFMPLAVMRRELWWRHFVLFASMVLFGLWHKASILFIAWGAYHGLLLVAHRLIQQAERSWDIDTDAPIWTPISWIVTMALISLGWIFFRANSLEKAKDMFATLVSPANYQTQALSASFYWLVLILAVGYGCVLMVTDALARTAEEGAPKNGMFAALARSRWYWLPPLYITLVLVLVIMSAGTSSNTADFMYRGF